MPSPIPKPTALKVFEGNPGKRRLPNEPKYAPLTEHPPEWIPREGRAEWRRLMHEFDRVGLARRPDRASMIALCWNWATYVAACRDMDVNGLVIDETTTYRGKTTKRKVKNPSVLIARDCLAQLIQLWGRFGMTPADRARIDIGEVNTEHDPRIHLLD